jgi:hypothetical protein
VLSTNFLTLAIMAGVAYAFLHEGVATAFCMFCNVVLAGFIAWNFWEPAAGWLQDQFAGGALQGYEDFFALMLLFGTSLGLLRLAANHLQPTQASLHGRVQFIGSLVFGLWTGYLLAGFLTCALQTLPWHEHFMHFDQRVDSTSATQRLRRWLPPDRVWLAMMQSASEGCLGQAEGPLFDPNATFEQRYARYRRYGENRDVFLYFGEIAP